MQPLYIYISGLFAIIAAAFGVYVKGRKSGSDASDAKHEQEQVSQERATLAERKKIDDIVKEGKRSADAETINHVRDRLKSSSVRKPSDKA